MIKSKYHFARLTLLLCIGLFMAGCTTKVAYNFLDWAIAWKIHSLVSLDSAQKEETMAAIRKFHSWHRQTQLPQYALYLHGFQNRINNDAPFTMTEIHGETDKVQLLLDQSLNFMLPDAVATLSQLDQDQVTELLHNLVKKRNEYKEEYVDISLKEQIEKRVDDFTSYFKQFMGSPNDQQKQQIKEWAKSMEPYEAASLKQQEIWQEEFTKTLSHRQDVVTLDRELKNLMFYRTDNWDQETKAIMHRNEDRTYTLIANLLNNMSDKQKQHLLKKLSDYEQIFTELNQEGVKQSATQPPETTH